MDAQCGLFSLSDGGIHIMSTALKTNFLASMQNYMNIHIYRMVILC